jgi:hypothetical protein
MSKIHTIDETAVWKVWNWCIDAYRRCGQTLKFPEATNPTKTYQWRYAARLAKKLEEWEFDDQTSIVFIRHAAEYAKEKRLLRKGLSAFFQSNILDICYDRIDDECEKVDRRLALLRQNHGFLSARADGKPIINILLSRPEPDSYYNIVDWFDRHRISTMYMAFSRSCTTALSRLSEISPDQRDLLPRPTELFCLMDSLTDNLIFKKQASQILGDDWRTL